MTQTSRPSAPQLRYLSQLAGERPWRLNKTGRATVRACLLKGWASHQSGTVQPVQITEAGRAVLAASK